MFRFKSQSRRAVAVSLRVVSLNVFFGQVVCALAVPAAASQENVHQHPAGTATHRHDSEAARKHGHEPAPATEHHQHDAPAPDAHQHGPKNDCCQDDAAAVWASLAHPPKAGIGEAGVPAGGFVPGSAGPGGPLSAMGPHAARAVGGSLADETPNTRHPHFHSVADCLIAPTRQGSRQHSYAVSGADLFVCPSRRLSRLFLPPSSGFPCSAMKDCRPWLKG